MRQGLSRDRILEIASHKDFFVDRFRWGQAELRKKCRRMCRDGMLMLVDQTKQGFYYRTNLPTK